MKKVVISVVLAIALVFGYRACSDIELPTTSAIAEQSTVTVQHSPEPTRAKPTHTPIPTATIGYELTAQAWESQANEAQAQANIEREKANNAVGTTNALEAMHIDATAQVEQDAHDREMEKLALEQRRLDLTATAFPAVMAQKDREAQVALAIAQDEAMRIAATQTKEATEMADRISYIGNIAMIVFGIAIIVVIAFLWIVVRASRIYREQAPAESKTANTFDKYYETSQKEKGKNGIEFDFCHGTRIWAGIAFCSLDQLYEFCERIVVSGETLGINKWEGADDSKTLWSRDVFVFFRENFLIDNGFAIVDENGLYHITEIGKWFCGYIKRTKPTHFPITIVFPENAIFPDQFTHMSANHRVDDGGEEVDDTESPVISGIVIN